MSISLGIQWFDGGRDIVPVAGQSTARWWAEIGRECALEHLSQIDGNGWPQFGPDTLEGVIADFEFLRRYVAERYPNPAEPGWSHPTESIDNVLAALRGLRGETNWEGDFG